MERETPAHASGGQVQVPFEDLECNANPAEVLGQEQAADSRAQDEDGFGAHLVFSFSVILLSGCSSDAATP